MHGMGQDGKVNYISSFNHVTFAIAAIKIIVEIF